MRKSLCITAASVCSLIVSATPTAKATILPINSSVSPNAQPDPFAGTSLVASTPPELFNLSLNGSTLAGNVQEFVFTQYNGNIFGSTNLTFVFQLNVTGGTTVSGAPAYLERIADSGFAGVNTDVGYRGIQALGIWIPGSADRSNGGDEIGFNFLPPNPSIGVGDGSSYLIINTNATQFAPSAISLEGTLATSVAGYGVATTPEPATLLFCGVGVGLMAMGRRRSVAV